MEFRGSLDEQKIVSLERYAELQGRDIRFGPK